MWGRRGIIIYTYLVGDTFRVGMKGSSFAYYIEGTVREGFIIYNWGGRKISSSTSIGQVGRDLQLYLVKDITINISWV